MLGWAATAPPAQVSIRLVFELALQIQPPQPGHTPGCPARCSPPPACPPRSGDFNFLLKVFWPNLAAVSTSLFICGAGEGRRGSGEGAEGSPTLG